MAWDEAWEEIHNTEDLGRYPSEHLIRFVRRTFGPLELNASVECTRGWMWTGRPSCILGPRGFLGGWG